MKNKNNFHSINLKALNPKPEVIENKFYLSDRYMTIILVHMGANGCLHWSEWCMAIILVHKGANSVTNTSATRHCTSNRFTGTRCKPHANSQDGRQARTTAQ